MVSAWMHGMGCRMHKLHCERRKAVWHDGVWYLIFCVVMWWRLVVGLFAISSWKPCSFLLAASKHFCFLLAWGSCCIDCLRIIYVTLDCLIGKQPKHNELLTEIKYTNSPVIIMHFTEVKARNTYIKALAQPKKVRDFFRPNLIWPVKEFLTFNALQSTNSALKLIYWRGIQSHLK